MNLISVKKNLPKEGSYLVRFTIRLLGTSTPFEDKVFYAEGYFNPSRGWSIENRYVKDCRYEQEYIDFPFDVTHWMEHPEPPQS